MLNEDLIEMAFIDQLTGQGFEFHHGPDIAPDSDNPQRKNFDSVVLENELLKAIEKLNHQFALNYFHHILRQLHPQNAPKINHHQCDRYD